MDIRSKRYEVQHGGTDWETDYDELVPVRKAGRRRKRSSACKKSKTGEPCVFDTPKVIGTYYKLDTDGNRVASEDKIWTCGRCGKYSWARYFEKYGW